MTHSLTALVRRRRLLVLVAASVLGALAWWFAWMAPTGSRLVRAQAAEVTSRATVASLQQRLVELQRAARHAGAARAFVGRVGRAIPASADAPQLVSQIYALALASGVKLQAITDDTVVRAGADYSAVPVTLSLSGRQAGIVAFVDGLYHLPRLITIQQLQLSGPGGVDVVAGTRGVETASINATAYTTAVTAGAGAAATSANAG